MSCQDLDRSPELPVLGGVEENPMVRLSKLTSASLDKVSIDSDNLWAHSVECKIEVVEMEGKDWLWLS